MSEWVQAELSADYADLRAKNAKVLEDRDNYEAWTELVTAAELLDGGLNRNSDPQAISAYRAVMDSFLLRYPLFFGYWKRYADSEFNIGGSEAAELVYERGIGSIPCSVDLYTNYCGFKMDTSHDADITRELFERAASAIGADFRSDPFWDKYIEFESRVEQPDRRFAILERVLHIPLGQCNSYLERFQREAQARPTDRLLIPDNAMEHLRSELQAEYAAMNTGPINNLQFERDLHAKADKYFADISHRTQAEVMKRWDFETKKIQRSYYLPQELPESEIQAWKEYLTFEEAEGDFQRTMFLYERCLVACANYDEFWLRYARWMYSQSEREEEVRNIFRRASYTHIPISQPAIRLLWAKFEESCGNLGLARDIYESIIATIPGLLEPIIDLANLERRNSGLDAAIKVYKSHIAEKNSSLSDKGCLVSEWAQLLWKVKGAPEQCRQVYQNNATYYPEVPKFWIDWFHFELAQPTNVDAQASRHEQIKKLFSDIRTQARLSATVIKTIAQEYQDYLVERGSADAMKEFMVVDREINGPTVIQQVVAANPSEQPTINGRKSALDNGGDSNRNRNGAGGNSHSPGINGSQFHNASPYDTHAPSHPSLRLSLGVGA